MKKTLSLVLALAMVLSMFSIPAFAEEKATPEADAMKLACDFKIIEANGDQPRLTYIEGETNILDVDGLKFKDMNGNGTLDVYEDYRKSADERAADLISQMTPEEEVGLLFCVSANLETARGMIPDFKNNCMLFNLNGTPVEVTNTLNHLQAAAEKERLSVPMTFTSDREYNPWGGYVDKSHEAFGTAYDPELAYKLAYFYGQTMVAIGIHVTFEPYAEEIGAQYGENPELIAKVVNAEIRGLEDSGFASCTKHWIGRGGDSAFGKARSVAQNFDNWMVGWKNALAGGSEWVMTNCGGTGITNTTDVKWDSVTMSYLRDTLGFQGVVVTDWWALGMRQQVSGVTNEGVELSEQSGEWLYGQALKNGTDVFGAGGISHGLEYTQNTMWNWPDVMLNGLTTGDVEKQYVDRAATRVLKFKFNKGIFENPYRVVDEMLTICASKEWTANQTPITTNEELRAARNPEEVAMTEKLQAESSVLVKNDNNLLPLATDTKVYFESSNADIKTNYSKYIGQAGTLVADIASADVCIGDFSTMDDAAEMFIEDAQAAGKKIVLILNNLDPSQYTLDNADAVMYLSYNQKADHGSTVAGFTTCVDPWVFTDMLYGKVQPGGVIVKEIARDAATDGEQWKDLAGDQGASPYVRLMVQATMEDDKEYHSSPNNWGDPLVQAFYGMKYGENAEFKYSCLIVPFEVVEKQDVDRRGNPISVVGTNNAAKVGETNYIYCLLRNNGTGDGITTVEVKDNGNVVASKVMTVCAGSWRVVEIPVTFETIGAHTIEVAGMTDTVNVTK